MKIDGIPTRTIRPNAARTGVEIIDQTLLPHQLSWLPIASLESAAHAIASMQVRGAPLIGATAAYGVAIAMLGDASDSHLNHAITLLRSTRPTAVNLHWALARMEKTLSRCAVNARPLTAWQEAQAIAEEDVAQNMAIGQHGLARFQTLTPRDGQTLQIMTHCNAGWLATVDAGTALSPIYALHDAGLPVHVWVSETRPRNQGLLTAWELAQHGVPHTVIADNAAGILMQNGTIDAVIVGADRIAANGDVANKVGTYLKALACQDNAVPFYVAAPRSTIDFACPNGRAIPIEERSADELRRVHGLNERGIPAALQQLSDKEAVGNPAFDVTPARLVTGIMTERGICPASTEGLLGLYPEASHD